MLCICSCRRRYVWIVVLSSQRRFDANNLSFVSKRLIAPHIYWIKVFVFKIIEGSCVIFRQPLVNKRIIEIKILKLRYLVLCKRIEKIEILFRDTIFKRSIDFLITIGNMTALKISVAFHELNRSWSVIVFRREVIAEMGHLIAKRFLSVIKRRDIVEIKISLKTYDFTVRCVEHVLINSMRFIRGSHHIVIVH